MTRAIWIVLEAEPTGRAIPPGPGRSADGEASRLGGREWDKGRGRSAATPWWDAELLGPRGSLSLDDEFPDSTGAGARDLRAGQELEKVFRLL